MTEQEAQLYQTLGALQMRQYDLEREVRMLKSRTSADSGSDATLSFLTGALVALIVVWVLRRWLADDEPEATPDKRRRRIEPVA
jgi:hypothetical protein